LASCRFIFFLNRLKERYLDLRRIISGGASSEFVNGGVTRNKNMISNKWLIIIFDNFIETFAKHQPLLT
jgi:hypothetical protein